MEAHFPHTAKRVAQRVDEPSECRLARAEERREAAIANHLPKKKVIRRRKGNDNSELAKKINDRLESASIRRKELIESRKANLSQNEQHRQDKIRAVKEMRQASILRFIQDAPPLLNILFKKHLAPGMLPKSTEIERILMEDPRYCNTCPKPVQNSICPTTHRPHKRWLVVVAERLLKLIGDTKVNLLPPKDSIDHDDCAVAVQRGISVNPQLFIIAYHTASCDHHEAPPLEHDAAMHVIDAVEDLRSCLLQNPTAEVVKALLNNFANGWRQFARIMDPMMSPSRRDTARKDLVNAMIDTYLQIQSAQLVRQRDIAERPRVSGIIQQRRAELDLGVTEAMSLLRRRLQRVGGTEALAKLDERMLEGVEQAGSSSPDAGSPSGAELSTPNTSPEVRPSTPTSPFIRSMKLPPANTERKLVFVSESEGETDTMRSAFREAAASSSSGLSQLSPPKPATRPPTPAVAQEATTTNTQNEVDEPVLEPLGPEVPPGWIVRDGISVPGPTVRKIDFLEEAKERKAKLEFRARSAHQARIKSGIAMNDQEDRMKKLGQIISEAMWAAFEEELKMSPPNVSRVPQLLRTVLDSLVEVHPKGMKSRAAQEARDLLDWSLLMKADSRDYKSLINVTRYVTAKLTQLGAPAREEGIVKTSENLIRRLEDNEAPSTVVVELFKFLSEGVQQLRQDIAEYTLSSIAGELCRNAVPYQREFAVSYHAPFTNTKHWLETVVMPKIVPDLRARALAGDMFAIKDALIVGIIDLITSADKTSTKRWDSFPSELFYFDRDIIFGAANQVQLLTLRTMIVGTVSMTLQQHHVRHPATLSSVDEQLATLLTQEDATLQTIKDMVVEEINVAIMDHAPHKRLLTEAEGAVVCSVIDKMADTTTAQYRVFESRVVTAIRAVMNAAKVERAPGTPLFTKELEETLTRCGIAQVQATKVAQELVFMLNHNWDVYSPIYSKLWKEIQQAMAPPSSVQPPSTAAAADDDSKSHRIVHVDPTPSTKPALPIPKGKEHSE